MLLQDLELLTMEPGAVPRRGSLRVEAGRIRTIGDVAPAPEEEVLPMPGLTALPGFVQGHVHLCQSLFRNLAEDLPLLDWLSRRVWPLEAAHDEQSLRASARLSLYELIRGGCTTFQSMETVHGTEFVFDEVSRSGLRAVIGSSLMDRDAPPGLLQTTDEALATARELRRAWHGAADGLISHAFCPRFLLSCSDALHREIAGARRNEGARVHTHAAEHPSETQAVLQARGKPYLIALAELGVLGPQTSLAHCVQLDGPETNALVESGAAVLHCPSTNLKLGSGIAPIAKLRQRGVRVALGADGAPANNRLDALTELRQAALLQSLAEGPGALPAHAALSLLTLEGARALGLDAECGSLEVGKAADLVILDLGDPALGPAGDAPTRIVYGADRSHIRHVMAGGRFLVRDGFLTGDLQDEVRLATDTERELQALLQRAGMRR